MIVYIPDSNKIVHCTYVDLSDRPINKPIHLVQYDNRIPILAVSIYDSGKTYTIPSTAKVNIRFSKPDETFVYNPALGIKSDNSIIYFEITKQMMSLSGLAKAVIEIEMYDSVACSSPISFIVDRNPIQHHSIESTIEFKTAQQYAKEAESWAHGNTGIRIGENTNNSKYWSEQSKDYANSWKGSLLPQGTLRFSQLPISGNIAGHMYNINEAFVTDSRFKDGAGYSYPAGTNVYWTQDGKWDCLSGILTREITQSQYDNLSNAEKTNGTIYYILDADNSINNASQNSAGLMSQEDKKKLDEIASGATRVLVDSSLSSTSTNSIQNRVITNALNTEIERAKAQEALKAPITNPTFYGIPRVSTANAGTNSTQIASTAFTQTAISNHNTSSNAHNDMRELITGLTNRLNALADSDDITLDQLSEIVAYIKNNKSLIENITTSKVNVSDIIDNLTSNVTNKPLAAKQGKVLKDLIDTLTGVVDGKVSKSGDTMTGTLYTKNLLVLSSSANGGTDGYINFARIKITGPYADRVVSFKIGGRYRGVTNVSVRFSGNNANPSVSSYWKNGDCSYGIYIFKSDEDIPTWDLCAQKYTSWGEVTVLTSHYTGTIEVTYPGTFVAEKGDNWIEAEIETIGNAFNSDTVDGKHASDFVSKSGDTMTGDLVVPIQRANANMSLPCAGRIDSTTLIPQGLSECKTFLGSIVDENSTFWNIISTRHGNGYNDGRYFGMYIRSLLLGEGSHGGSLLWNKQMGSNKGWLGERVLLDSVNYKDFCLPLSGGVITGEILVTYGRMTNFNGDYGGVIAGGSIVSNNLTDLSNYRSFVGTHLNANNKWNHVISARHHNGYGDGNLYGMYLRTPITTNEDDMNLYWRFQNSNWADERVLLDSQNYEKYCLPLSNEYLIAENSVCRISLLSKVGNTQRCGIEAYTKGNGRTGGLYFYNGNATLKSYNTFSIDVTEDVDVARAYYFDTDGLYPIIDHVDLGKSSFHWRNIYANNGTIQTSDRTKKTDINSLEAQKVQAFINGLNPVSYKMLDGTSGRTHYGFIAQDIEELIIQLGMDSKDFAGFIKSPKKIIKYEDENGKELENPIEEVIEGEYDYALRYDEFIAPLIAVVQEQQKTIDNQQKEIEELKKEMKKLQEIVLKIV